MASLSDFVSKFYLPLPAVLLVMELLELLVILPLFYHLLLIIADQNML